MVTVTHWPQWRRYSVERCGQTHSEDLAFCLGDKEFSWCSHKQKRGEIEDIAVRIRQSVKHNADIIISGGAALFTHRRCFDELTGEADSLAQHVKMVAATECTATIPELDFLKNRPYGNAIMTKQ